MMEILYPRCAGLDIHRDSIVACVRLADSRIERHVESFGTTTTELERLSAWLSSYQVTHVAMESGSRAPLPEPSPLRTGHDDCSSSGSSLGRFILAARKIRSWIRPTTASVAVQSTLDHVIGCRPSVCSALTV
jgi:hypothetical protein